MKIHFHNADHFRCFFFSSTSLMEITALSSWYDYNLSRVNHFAADAVAWAWMLCVEQREKLIILWYEKKSNIFFLHRMHTQHAAVAPHKYDTDIKSRWKENTTNNKLLAVFTFLLSRFQLTIYAWRREWESRNQTIPALIMIMISQWVGTEFQSSCNFLLIIKFYSLALFYTSPREMWQIDLWCSKVAREWFFPLFINSR